VAVEAFAVDPEEDRALAALADCEIDRTGRAWGERDGDYLAALAHDGESSMSAFEAKRLDVGTGRFGDPQSVQGEQRDEGVLDGWSEPGGHKKRTEFISVEPGDVRLVVEPGPTDMNRWRVIEKLLLDGVAVETGDGAESPGYRCASPPALLEVAAEALDVSAPCLEEADVVLLAPSGELAQIERVRLSGQSAIASKIATERDPLGITEHGL
jgi:hypothetical protein